MPVGLNLIAERREAQKNSSKILGLKPRRSTTALPLNTIAKTKVLRTIHR
ncbi:MAG: hypothetical protein GPJ07_24450 [Microcystis aeruginosa G13-07]|nr:hypothetical protein [Microcystis aeruginosa LL13-06]NCR92018.1 hypothetical protein [Microcystis aeruginosa G13-10]NCS04874.1 hypothetical protein [Microcystis aeruginosa G13-11]NCS09391.1 hypothetical protein [Microcystis aeruginosa G13-07]NCS22571.1 hypothetical protein [Microcystis aeruginosa G11-06]NCS37235.1 hypothetical protein [Microcystis aeruginosa G11-01]NCT65285.1 hypothetical protein [Microcystis aeruginosa G13-01]